MSHEGVGRGRISGYLDDSMEFAMTAATTGRRPLLTYRGYLHTPDDGRRWEILDGDLCVTPAPSTYHQDVSRRLQFRLMSALELTGRARVYNAPVDVRLHEHTIVQPDLAVVLTEHAERVESAYIMGPPDLVVEILSPSTQRRDRTIKATLYARHGVRWYWVVDPVERCVDVYARDGEAFELLRRESTRLVWEAVEGVEIDLAWVFDG